MRTWIAVIVLVIGWTMPGPGAAQDLPRIEVALDKDETVVGQPVVLRIKVLVPSWLPEPPEFPNFEVPGLMVRLPSRATQPVSETIEGDTWSGVQRSYRLYPLAAQRFVLAQSTLTIRYADPGQTAPLVSETALPEISFVATIPAAARDLDPLILATGFTLEQSFDGDPEMAAGDAITRSIIASIDGTTPVLIPALTPELDPELNPGAGSPDEMAGLRPYAKEPQVQETETGGQLSGTRRETVTYLAQTGGRVALPALSLRWFNLETGEIETADLPGLDLTIEDAPAVMDRPDATQIATWLVGAVALVLVFWGLRRWLSPWARSRSRALRAAWVQSERYAHRQVRAGFAARDLDRVTRALERWAEVCAIPPIREGAPMRAALARIGAQAYGPDPASATTGWPEAARAYEDLRRAGLQARKSRQGTTVLPPLNPVK